MFLPASGLWLPSQAKGMYPAGPWGLVCFLFLNSKASGLRSKVMQNLQSLSPTTTYLIYIQASQTKTFQKGIPPELMCVCLVVVRALFVPQVFFPNKNKICRDHWEQRQ